MCCHRGAGAPGADDTVGGGVDAADAEVGAEPEVDGDGPRAGAPLEHAVRAATSTAVPYLRHLTRPECRAGPEPKLTDRHLRPGATGQTWFRHDTAAWTHAWHAMTAAALEVRRARGRALAVTAGTALCGVVVVSMARWGPDWPAQEFRAWIAVHDGLSAWTARWYGGSALPGYSILYPPLAKLVGAGGVGLASVVSAAWAAMGLAPRDPRRARWYAFAVGMNLVETLVIGQVPFLLGTAFGVLAFRSLVRGRHWAIVLALATLSSLATPLTGAFLVLVLPACAASIGTRRALALTGGLVGPVCALGLGGAAGPFPMPWLLFAATISFCVLTGLLAPPEHRGLRVLACCYLLATIVVFVVPNPIGGNLARLGKLIALPLACHFLAVERPWLRARAAIVATLAFLWPTVPFLGSVAHGANDPSQAESFYSGMISYLQHHRSDAGRVEIPFTREHWEAYWLARRVSIARGWERQTDYRYNAVLYRPLTPTAYRSWLVANAVDFVALPDVPIDVGGAAEARLLRRPPPYLEPVWHDAHWQLWRVRDPAQLVVGAAALRDFDASSIDLNFAHSGSAEVRMRYDPLWHVSAGRACITESPTGWIDVRAARAGPVGLNATVNGQVLVGGDHC